MHFARFRISGLLIVAAGIELFMGLGFYLFPQEFRSPVFNGMRPYFDLMATGLLSGGVTLLLLARYPLPNWVRRLLALLPALPLLVLAAYLGRAGLRGAPYFWGIIGSSIVLAPWLPRDPQGRWRLSLVTLSLLQIVIGGRMLLFPKSFGGPAYAWMTDWVPLLGLVGVLGGLAVAAIRPDASGRKVAWLALAGSLYPLFMSLNNWRAGVFSGFVAWGVWLFANAGVLWRAVGARPVVTDHERDDLNWSETAERAERQLEVWSWMMLLLVVTVSLVGGPHRIASPVTVHIFVIAVSAYNGLAYMLFPRLGHPDRRILTHLAVLATALAFLLSDGGEWALILSALLVLPPFVAARVLGATVGSAILSLTIATSALFQLYHTQIAGHGHLDLGQAVAQILIIGSAGLVVVRSAAEQRQLVADLARARSALQRQVQQQQLVMGIGQAIRSSLDLDRILSTAVHELGPAFQVSRCFIRLRGGDGFLPITHQYTAPGVDPLSPDQVKLLVMARVVAETRQVEVVEDVLRHPIWKEVGPVLGTRAAVAAPILDENGLLGVITFHQCGEPRTWTPDEIRALEAVASQVAVAIAHATAHRNLAEKHAVLAKANRDLLLQGEELEAQREELKAQNDELVGQGSLLFQQAKKLEQALYAARTAEQAHSQMSAVLEATTDFVGLTDRSGAVLHLNRAARSALRVEEGTTLSIQQIFATWFVDVIFQKAMRVAIREGSWSGEGALLTASGEEIPVSMVILAHRDPDGKIDFFATIARDITDQKASEAALRDSEERFRSAFGDAPIGMGLVGANGRWLQVNRPLCEIVGYSEDELQSMVVGKLIHPEDHTASLGNVAKLLHGEQRSYQMEQRWFHKQGHVVWTQVGVSIVRTADQSFHYVVHVQDITDRKRAEAQMTRLANYDTLTDLFNRRRFEEELERQLASSTRYGTNGALIFLDLDQFKYINDSLGHQAGDLMLRSLAKLLRGLLRESDAIARLGGDEFAILLPQADATQAKAVAEKILHALRSHVEVINGRAIGITGSIGVALFPEHGRTAEELLAFADMAMYQVKDGGRNSYVLYSADTLTRAELESKLTWERRIQEALATGGFMLYQQPILHLDSGRIHRYEALLRMKGPNGEVISPGTFLPVAERFGLIHAIDRWVVKQAIHAIARRQATEPGFCLEVNLSGKAFGDPELLPLIRRELDATGIDPALLILEITETAACADTVKGREFVTTLRGLGCRFALDDFGSGFSSFSYLKNLPVDYLKIDGSFIHQLAGDPVDQQLVQAMVAVARGLGRQIIAECVEDADSLAMLHAMGVDFAQGYHIGRPVPMPNL